MSYLTIPDFKKHFFRTIEIDLPKSTYFYMKPTVYELTGDNILNKEI